MSVLKISTVALAALFIAGCSSGEPAPAPAAPPPPPKTVFDPLTNQLDRARDVQNTVDQSAERSRKAVDAQERGDSAP
jgi:PBP1b-binding outer membrane lipoprotein LpoB